METAQLERTIKTFILFNQKKLSQMHTIHRSQHISPFGKPGAHYAS
jgi:hypothetical protein